MLPALFSQVLTIAESRPLGIAGTHKSTLTELLQDQAKLERQIAEARNAPHAEAIAQIRALMALNGLTAADFAGKAAPSPAARPRAKVAAKFCERSSEL